MPGHNFEDKVQQQLKELQLQPSDAVWSHVENEIRKDKRRRRLIFWIPFLALLLGGGIFWAIVNPKSPEPIQNRNHASKNTTDAPVPADLPATLTPGKDSRAPGNLVAKDKPQQGTLTAGILKSNKLAVSPKLHGKKSVAPKGKNLNSGQTIALREKPSIVTNDEIDKSNVAGNQVINTIDSNSTVNTDNLNKLIDPAKDSSLADAAKPVIASVNSDSSVAKKKPASKKSWQWGITAGTGITNVTDGSFLSVFGASAMSDYGNVSSPGGPTQSTAPSSVKEGWGWSGGVFVQKQLNKRLSLATGINYRLYVTHIDVGLKVDSNLIVNNNFSSSYRVDNFYRNGSSGSYSNHYHFIELPVTLNIRLNKSAKSPMFWNAGLALQQLVATDALHYDNTSGNYYEDNGLFNKTQVSLGTGFSISLFNRGSHPIELGPQFQYNLSNLRDQSISGSNHLLWLGLNAKWYIKK